MWRSQLDFSSFQLLLKSPLIFYYLINNKSWGYGKKIKLRAEARYFVECVNKWMNELIFSRQSKCVDVFNLSFIYKCQNINTFNILLLCDVQVIKHVILCYLFIFRYKRLWFSAGNIFLKVLNRIWSVT